MLVATELKLVIAFSPPCPQLVTNSKFLLYNKIDNWFSAVHFVFIFRSTKKKAQWL